MNNIIIIRNYNQSYNLFYCFEQGSVLQFISAFQGLFGEEGTF